MEAASDYPRLAKRNAKFGPGIDPLVVGLPVEMLVLEEEYGVVTPDRRPKESRGVERGRRHDHPKAGDVREGDLSRLRVIGPASGKVASDRHADDDRGGEPAAGAPAD